MRYLSLFPRRDDHDERQGPVGSIQKRSHVVCHPFDQLGDEGRVGLEASALKETEYTREALAM
jgi:hypothetical protein